MNDITVSLTQVKIHTEITTRSFSVLAPFSAITFERIFNFFYYKIRLCERNEYVNVVAVGLNSYSEMEVSRIG